MTTIKDVLDAADRSDVHLYLDGGKLKFKSRSGGLPDGLREQLRQHRDGVVEYLRKALNATAPEFRLTEIRPVAHKERLPLSFAQQRLWVLHELEGGSPHYNMPGAVRMSGSLDKAVVRKALRSIVERHEVLRTSFQAEGIEVFQCVHSEFELPLREFDLSGLDAAVKERESQRILREQASEAFDLRRAPLLRVAILSLAADEHLLSFNFHHIVFDAWSYGVVIREFSELYAAFVAGRDNPLPPMQLQYADYALWQRDWLRGEVEERHLAYWKAHMVGAPSAHNLPLDRPRPKQQTFVGATHRQHLDQTLTSQIRALCQRSGATLFMFLETAFALLLSRYSDEEDIVIGTPIAGRAHKSVESMVGFFVNTLTLRSTFDDQESFESALGRNRRTILDAFTYQHLPFEALVEELKPERSLSYGPLFQVLFSLQNNELRELELPGVVLAPVAATVAATKFDLELSAAEWGGALDFSWTYNTDLFDEPTVERLAAAFDCLLRGVVTNPHASIATLPVVTEADRRHLLRDWAAGKDVYPRDQLVHTLFYAQARARRDDIAVVCRGDSLTYAELNRRSNRLARFLLEQGIARGAAVGLCTDRSIDMIVGMLGILKAGAAYVPVDPNYPADRIAYMLNDAAAGIVLIQTHLLAEVPLPDLRTFALDGKASFDVLNSYSDEDVAIAGAVEPALDLANIIYTSGSTGRPKGVMVPHLGIVRLVTKPDFVPLDEATVMLHASSPSFDVSTFEIWGTLLNGGKLIVYPERHIDTAVVNAQIAAHHVNMLWLTASLFEQWSFDLPTSSSLKWVLAGGDVVSPAAVQRVHRHDDAITVINGYGPTENTVFTCCYVIPRCFAVDRSVPIGRPVNGTSNYVLSRRGQLMPPGAIGELHTAGAGIARGYLNKQSLTEEKFVANPFAEDGHAVLYKTGDLVRYLPDGMLEYIGRADNQVKLRGFRIELGEIEATLNLLEGVRESVVVLRGQSSNKQIVGYVVAPDVEDEAAFITTLQQALRSRLPDFMQPSRVVRLPLLPLSPNGKVDKRALPEPAEPDVEASEDVPPSSPLEKQIAQIWLEVLGKENVGANANFFEIGGHSLRAVQVISRLRKTLGIELAVRTLFEHPTVASLANAIRVSDEQVKLPDIRPAERNRPLPLSWAQQRLWFLDRLDSAAGAAYHIPIGLRLRGDLDCRALRAALDRVVERHEVLRTTFALEDGQPIQCIGSAEQGFALVEHDLTELSEQRRQALIAEYSASEAIRPFSLGSGPLIRGQLLRLADDDHVLLITQHHIVSDAWSLGVFVREVATLYAAFRSEERDPLPSLRVQYGDYASWQRQWLQGAALQAQIEFWRGHLDGAPALLDFPLDRPRPAVRSFKGGAVSFTVPADLAQGLRELSRRHDVTLFMTLLSAWALVLSRLSGQDDVVVGTPVANRQRMEVEPLIGFFVNTLAVRIRLDEEPSVAGLLAQVKHTLLGAYSHQDVPFEQVVEAVQPPRSMSHSPIFQVMLALDNTPRDQALAVPGMVFEPVLAPNTTAHFDLSLSLTDFDEVLGASLGYSSDLFDVATVEGIAGHWQAVLRGMLLDDGRSAVEIPLLDECERQELLIGFNSTATPHRGDCFVHQLFEEQAAANGDRLALVFNEQALTYSDLNRRANQLAHHLLARGIRPSDHIAIYMDRSVELVVAQLGTLKAGAAFVPLDPAYPRERLAYMLEDSHPAMLLTQSALLDRIGKDGGLEVLALDTMTFPDAVVHDPRPQTLGLTPAHPAYVIYTSGSTGMPKGVVNHHAGISNLVQDNIRTFDLQNRSRMLQFASCSFDASVWEISMALCAGSVLHLAMRDELLPGAPLARTLRARAITHVVLSPSALAALPVDEEFPALECVIAGGEALSTALADQWASRYRLFNAYGPTEATVCSTIFACSADDTRTVAIGRPIANASVYILDRAMQPVPIGVTGEIYIGGIGVSHGYHRRAELTRERFLPDPFSTKPGAQVYRSGDLGRWRRDGNIEYVGRSDFQVKVRGFRIELGEIEARLVAMPGVREAVVIAREDTPGDKRLVAYVVPVADAELSAATLRALLAEQLPEHMLPAAYVCLDRMPLTSNGKLDRRALPAPDASAAASRAYEAPLGYVEQTLASIWSDLLRVPDVGRHDHFFELGGHSLLAVQLASQVRVRLGVELPLRAVFDQPTVTGMARAVAVADPTVLPSIVASDRSDALPLSWSQQRLWFLAQLDSAASRAYHIPVALRLRGLLDGVALQAALDGVVARHESLRTVFVSADGRPVQVIKPPRPFDLVLEDLTQLSHEDRQSVVVQRSVEEGSKLFDFANGPLIRGRLLELATDEHVLLITQHHIVSDGWSVGVFLREVSALYDALSRGQKATLPPLSVQYGDYATWQRQRVHDGALELQAAFWRDALSGAPSLLTLPLDRPRPSTQSYLGAQISVRVAPELTAGLRSLAQRYDCTLFMVLLGSWAILLSRLSGQDDIVVGTPVANRTRAELEPLIGLFVNTLALRVRTDADTSVAALLAQIKANASLAYANQDLPFDQLVEALQPQRSLAHSPLFQAMFALDNTPARTVSPSTLTLEPLELDRRTTHFDISLSLGMTREGLVGSIDYARDLFDAETVARWAGYWQALLVAMVADDGQSISRLRMIGTAERRRLLFDFNDTAADFPRDCLVHERFEALVATQPEAAAVVHEGAALSYDDLNRRANQLARHLIELGVGADVPVALCLERSPEMVVAIVAVSKAGGAYVPIDPELPLDRVSYMLANSQARVLIKTSHVLQGHVFDDVGLVELDSPELNASLSAQPGANIDAQLLGLKASHLAYVIYTSGSTGRPKGVMVEHEALVNRINWMQKQYLLTPDDRVLQKTPYGFDVSVWEFWWTLSEGATLVMARPGGHRDPAYVKEIIKAQGVTTLHFVPSMLASMIASKNWAECASVRQVFCSGEALDKRLVTDYWRTGTSAALHNLYGPTEAAIDVTYWDCANHARVDAIPIGRPIDNIQVYVLDSRGEPAPIGVAGELHIGGTGLARGYIGNSGLTDEKFIENHLREAYGAPSARLYKTGDLARWTEQGLIEYIGRIDNQVKINGLRIELSEIESCLMSHEEIREAVVLARTLDHQANGGRHLVAYFVRANATPTDDSMRASEDRKSRYRAFLREKLPEYMVPSIMIELNSMPTTANGKADRKALPSPTTSDVQRHDYVAARSPLEVTLCQIWQDVLGVDRVGVHDNYFELGGNSLSTVQVVSRAKSAGIGVTVGHVFKAPTVAGLAELATLIPHGMPIPRESSQDGDDWRFTGHIRGDALVFDEPVGEDFTETHMRHLVKTLCRQFPALGGRLERPGSQPGVRDGLVDRETLRSILRVERLETPPTSQVDVLEMLRERVRSEVSSSDGTPFKAVLLLSDKAAHRVVLAAHPALIDRTQAHELAEIARRACASSR